MTLYVVTHGCYSDYGICAIFDTREMADAYIDGKTDDWGVEEYELNPHVDRIREGLRTHYVVLDRDGNLQRHEQSFGEDADAGDVSHPWRKEEPRYFHVTVIAKTKEQAVKAANERRAAHISAYGWQSRDERTTA